MAARRKIFLLFLSILFILSIFLIISRAQRDEITKIHAYGDSWTERDIITAGTNFARYGFLKCKFLPVYNIEAGIDEEMKFDRHNMPVAHWLNGFLQSIGIYNLFYFRLVTTALSVISLFLFYFLAKEILRDETAVFLSIAYLLLCPSWLYWAASITPTVYAVILQLGTFLLYLAYRRNEKLWQLSGLFFLLFLLSLTALTHILATFLFFVIYELIERRRVSAAFRFLSSALCIIILAGLLRFSLNIWGMGDLKSALDENLSYFLFRTMDIRTQSTAIGNRLNILSFFNTLPWRIEAFYSFKVWQFLSVILFGFLLARGEFLKRQVKILLLFLIPSIAWWFIFLQHSFEHPYVTRDIILYIALAVGLSLSVISRKTIQVLRERKWGRALLPSCLLLLAVYVCISRYSFMLGDEWRRREGYAVRYKENYDLTKRVKQEDISEFKTYEIIQARRFLMCDDGYLEKVDKELEKRQTTRWVFGKKVVLLGLEKTVAGKLAVNLRIIEPVFAGYPIEIFLKDKELNLLGRFSALTPLSLRGDYMTMLLDFSDLKTVRSLELYIRDIYGRRRPLAVSGKMGLKFDLTMLDKPEYL